MNERKKRLYYRVLREMAIHFMSCNGTQSLDDWVARWKGTEYEKMAVEIAAAITRKLRHRK